MRLADVKWRKVDAPELVYETWVAHLGKKLQIWNWVNTGHWCYPGDGPGYKLNITSDLELACWLADKEPCDAPDPHPDY